MLVAGPLSGTCREIVEPIFCHCLAKVQCGARSLIDAVAAHGIAYLAENLAVAYELIDKQFAVLVVNIVVACAVD